MNKSDFTDEQLLEIEQLYYKYLVVKKALAICIKMPKNTVYNSLDIEWSITSILDYPTVSKCTDMANVAIKRKGKKWINQ